MTARIDPSAIPQSNFTIKTLQTILGVARQELKNIETAIAHAKTTGSSTAHLNERLRQTSNVLRVATKEYQNLGMPSNVS